MNNRLLTAVIVLALAGFACGGNIALPGVPTAGPERLDQINVPAPAAGAARLTISFGAGELKLAPGASNLVDGTATYNLEELKPQIVADGVNIEIKQGELLRLVEPHGIKSIWDFKLGSSPMDLSINAGAYEGEFELGGLSLTELTVKDGAAAVDLSFAEPNPSAMTIFRYETGASKVTMTGLSNANFSTMMVNSGAGDYTLDFSGELQRDATITISTGLSGLTLVIPQGVTANITAETGFSDVSAGPSWTQDGNRYSQAGSGPVLTFVIKAGAGSLTLSD
ncbi:MAG: toast rack family protein [Chloroflexota bacterium]